MIGNSIRKFVNFYLPLILSGVLIVISTFYVVGFTFPKVAHAAIAIDTSGNSGSTSASSNKATFSYTTGAGLTNSIIICATAWNSVSTITGAKYNGSAMTHVDGISGGSVINIDEWYLLAPASGANTVETDFSAATVSQVGISCVTLSGVDQTNPLDAHATSTGTSLTPTVTITTVADNSWIVESLGYGSATGSNTLTVNSPQVNRNQYTLGTRQTEQSTYEGVSPAGSKTVGWTTTGTARVYSEVAGSFKPASVTPAVITPSKHQVIIIGDKPRPSPVKLLAQVKRNN